VEGGDHVLDVFSEERSVDVDAPDEAEAVVVVEDLAEEPGSGGGVERGEDEVVEDRVDGAEEGQATAVAEQEGAHGSAAYQGHW